MVFPGSPPPMRGKAKAKRFLIASPRITPAYAGKRIFDESYRLYVWDHPRLCGEKQKIRHHVLTVTGSPPPMRGKVYCFRTQKERFRITPAYAGKSCHENRR